MCIDKYIKNKIQDKIEQEQPVDLKGFSNQISKESLSSFVSFIFYNSHKLNNNIASVRRHST